MNIDTLLDEYGCYGKRNITQLFQHTNFETRTATDPKMTLSTTKSAISLMYVTCVLESQISILFSLRKKLFSSYMPL